MEVLLSGRPPPFGGAVDYRPVLQLYNSQVASVRRIGLRRRRGRQHTLAFFLFFSRWDVNGASASYDDQLLVGGEGVHLLALGG